jgi:cysteine desulfurase
VVRITSGFQQEAPLNSAAQKVITQLFDKAWTDPEKINQQSREAAILLNEARNTFSKYLNVRADEIEFLGEVNLGFHLGISGLLKSDSRVIYSSIDKQNVHAVAINWEQMGNQVCCLAVNQQGQIQISDLTENDLLCWQVANGETGIVQNQSPSNPLIFADCTSSGVDYLPEFSYQSALFDSRSWQGPAGLGILVIKDSANWRNPLPHNDYVRTPNSYSVPLALASAVALEAYVTEKDLINNYKGALIAQLDQSKINFTYPTNSKTLPKYLNLIFPDLEADRLVLELQDAGFAVDSGSACRSADMQPSHVLFAMNYPTTGSIRITFHPHITLPQVQELGEAIISKVKKLSN